MAARKSSKDALDLYQDLMRSFERNRFKPLYLIYGTESFLPGRIQRHLIRYALQEHERDFNLDVVYGGDTDADSVLAMCQLVPMMAKRRVVIVRQFEKLRNNRRFAAYAKKPNPQAVVLLRCSGKPRFNADPYRTLRHNATCAQFEPLNRRRLPGFVSRMARQSGCQLADGAAQTLVDFAGSSLSDLANELAKLQTYVGDRQVITREDIVQASGQTREINIFELQDALAYRRYADSHRICEQLLLSASNMRAECMRIVYTLSTYFVRLWKLHGFTGARKSSNALAKELGAPKFIIDMQLRALRHWPPAELTRVLNALLSAEAELKGGSQRSPRLIMTLLLNSVLIKPEARNINRN